LPPPPGLSTITTMPRLAEFHHDPAAPPARDLVAAAYAVVRDDGGRVLLVRRADDGRWELPGGRIDVGETASAAAVRETAEESGVAVTVTGLAGVFSDPGHVLVYPGEGARQQLAVCFHAVPAAPDAVPGPDHDETVAAAWFAPEATADLDVHPAVRLRLRHALDHPDAPHFD
jgi:8-oxo-dGTP pyrophosphatase MutT (NUDIX family)